MVKFTGGGGSPIETRNALLDAPPSCYQNGYAPSSPSSLLYFLQTQFRMRWRAPEIMVGEGKQELGLAGELPSF